MGIDYGSLSDVLKNPIRRRIILTLSGSACISYVDLMKLVEVSNTGKFNYHLKTLGDLIQKDANGKYCLTEKGRMAAQLLQKFPEKEAEPKSLRMADATLIGFAGFVVVAANPILLVGLLLMIWELTVQPFPVLVVFGVSSFLFSLVIPGAIMWFLSVRRANSHDLYDLLKPPFVAFLLSLIILLVMYLVGMDVRATFSTPLEDISQYHSRNISTGVSLAGNLVAGLMYSFLGVAIAEAASRLRHKFSK
jgi:hypothetical protein